MMKRNDNKDWLLVAFLLLALVNRGPFGTAPKPTDMAPGDPTGRSGTDTTPKGTDSPGKNSSPPDNGVNSRNAPGDPTTTGSGAPDKSKSMSPPGAPGMMPTFMIPPGANVANYINPSPPIGGTVLPGGNIFIAGLTDTGFSSGGPGPGPTTPSITTVYGDKTYTNFDPLLLVANKNPGPAAPEMMKQMPTPPMMAPMMVPVGMMFPGGPPGPIIPVYVPPPTMYTIGLISSTGVRSQPTPPMMAPMPTSKSNLPSLQDVMNSGRITNPLPQQQDFLQMLLQMGGGFGQNALNNLLNAGKNLSGLFSNLQGIAIPGIPQAPMILPDIAI